MGLFHLKGNHPKRSGEANPTNGPSNNPSRQHQTASTSAPAPSPPYQQRTYNAPLQPTPPSTDPPPYHDWTVIPDTSLLPPPPAVGHDEPAINNAERIEADRAHNWCKANPLLFPHQPSPSQVAAVRNGQINLIQPREYRGQLAQTSIGSWHGTTKPAMKDACLLTSLPLYYAWTDSPTHSGKPKTIYFEVEIRSTGYVGSNDESTVALGYCALPFPTWRLPGWERASLGVHSDDGHRYVNDTWGGKDFTSPLKAGDTVGLGMSFIVPEDPPEYNVDCTQTRLQNKVEVFLTRNGKTDGAWNLHEELDVENDQPVDGLDGLFDLYGAIGIFGVVDFVVKLKREEWLWRPH